MTSTLRPGLLASEARTVVDWLEARPSWPGLYAPEPTGLHETLLSRDGLLVRAAAGAHELRQAGLMPGDRVMILLPANAALPVVVFGAWLAGGVLAPAGWAAPSGFRRSLLETLRAVFLAASPRAVVGTPTSLGVLKECGVRLTDVALFTDSELWKRTSLPVGDPEVRPGPADPALLQLGADGPPGRLVRHAELLTRLRGAPCASEDLLEALLLPLVMGIPTHLIPMQTFVGSPHGWASSLSRLGGRTSVCLVGEGEGAPPPECLCATDRWGLASAPTFAGYYYASIVFHRGPHPGT